ncbi:BRCT domain-containing protein [Sedimentitalea sp. JM2-8]|uniref:BRCT domain-containing protein n=1 Tax=Sedimentitalea xiamensis TaxID=3050037 RepID=A0ABT7FG93_9RHOB|nr:BRCT domain-containing protein [Sedimentitalea xiamensis]MDK3074097.1 BRCT domain-containing protein [Sedimentitalea xiamensis]
MKHGIFRICEHGYAHWVYPHLMTGEEANRMADSEYPDCHVLPYWRYLQLQDPDEMSEPALRRKLKLPARDTRRTIAITGKVSDMTRQECVAIAESKGYRVVSRVSAATSLVVYGDGGGRKAHDARKMGVPIKAWSQFT